MYNFATPGSSANNAIDLASSPSNGYRRRRVSSVSKVEIASGRTGAKKLVVKNFRTTPKTDPGQYCDTTTTQLNDALTAIFAEQRPTLSNEELYRGCENVCKLGRADQLGSLLLQRLRRYVSEDLKASVASSTDTSGVAILQVIITAWHKWRKQLVSRRTPKTTTCYKLTQTNRIPYDRYLLSLIAPISYKSRNLSRSLAFNTLTSTFVWHSSQKY
jgi:hypothetical protein